MLCRCCVVAWPYVRQEWMIFNHVKTGRNFVSKIRISIADAFVVCCMNLIWFDLIWFRSNTNGYCCIYFCRCHLSFFTHRFVKLLFIAKLIVIADDSEHGSIVLQVRYRKILLRVHIHTSWWWHHSAEQRLFVKMKELVYWDHFFFRLCGNSSEWKMGLKVKKGSLSFLKDPKLFRLIMYRYSLLTFWVPNLPPG